MSHVDDGQLNALLDGELSAHEARAVEAHVASCAECRRRYEEARDFLREAGALIESLTPGAAPAPAPVPIAQPAAARPPVRPSVTAPEMVRPDGVAPLDPKFAAAKAEASAPKEPRRVSKTLKEVAVTLDGRTEKTPAIQPVFPHEVPPVPKKVRTWDLEKFALAASIVLALGVGYLANEVFHMKEVERNLAAAEGARISAPTVSPPAQAAPAGSVGTETSARRPAVAHNAPDRLRTTGAPAEQRQQPRRDELAFADRAARDAAGPATSPARSNEAGGAGIAGASGVLRIDKPRSARVKVPPAVVNSGAHGDLASGQPAPMAAPSAPAPSASAESSTDALQRRSNLAAGASGAVPRAAIQAPTAEAVAAPGFRRVTLEEAVQFLAAPIRQIEGLKPIRIDVAPGRLVSLADPTRNVIRVTYTDLQNRIFRLDQQPVDRGGANGLLTGDTLVATEGTTARVRWLDGRFWLSLTGPVSGDEIRALVARVR